MAQTREAGQHTGSKSAAVGGPEQASDPMAQLLPIQSSYLQSAQLTDASNEDGPWGTPADLQSDELRRAHSEPRTAVSGGVRLRETGQRVGKSAAAAGQHQRPQTGPLSRASFMRAVLEARDQRTSELTDERVLEIAKAKELMTGEFPERMITRAEAASILLKNAGVADTQFDGKVVFFIDCFEGTWQFSIAHIARLFGIFTGTSENRFMPDEPLDAGHVGEVIGRSMSATLKTIAEQSAHLTVEPLTEPASPEPAWVTVARGELGVKRLPGAAQEPRIAEYHQATDLVANEDTPWCASFVNWALQKAGHSGNRSAWAKNFASFGVRLDGPAYGSIAVIDWSVVDGSKGGHVGFVVGQSGSNVLLLGGNQTKDSAVTITPFPKAHIAAYVVPEGYTVPESAYSLSPDGSATKDVGTFSTTR